MHSWVYLFSQFTTEAMLFEALGILFLCCVYAAFWILKKRRFGVVDVSIPAGPVKTYLNELVNNAEQLRLQLFGLLSSASVVGSMPLPQTFGIDSDLGKKLAALEAKMV